MDIVVSLDHRFNLTQDGKLWTETTFAYPFWLRYLEVFDNVYVLARAKGVSKPNPHWKHVNEKGVSFVNIPYYVGPWQYLINAQKVIRTVRGALKPERAIIMRVSSQIAAVLLPALRRSGHPFGLELVSDPYDEFSPGSFRHPLCPFFRWLFTRRLQQQCKYASAVAYVTEHTLQQRYPTAKDTYSTQYSSVEFPETAFASAPRSFGPESRNRNLLFVGMLDRFYKAPDVLIDAIADCINDGLDLKLTIVGDGKRRSELEKQSAKLGIEDQLRFKGSLPAGEAVFSEMDSADLFVLPSRQEGLPRAMIEAMARGLPCIGSTVGGIPELLSSEDMVPPNDAQALSRKIKEVLSDPKRMENMSARNLMIANRYKNEILQPRRINFYKYLRAKTEAWRRTWIS